MQMEEARVMDEWVVFFFQAEDGIRDLTVTGVQTCALPIYPELAERICGLARLLRTNALAALENVALWHERDISHSSVERVILPDSTIMLDYLLHLAAFIVEGLEVDTVRMAENLELSHGVVYSQRVLLKLTDAGLPRQTAYEIVQKNAMRAWKERRSFFELLAADPDVTARLSADELKSSFDPAFL